MTTPASSSAAARSLTRRDFLGHSARAGAAGVAWSAIPGLQARPASAAQPRPGRARAREWAADLVVCGAGLGGIAAALAACRNGARVVLTEATDWIGGQMTSQGVPPDEHRWIEEHGCTRSYRALRDGIRDYYRRHYPLTDEARQNRLLNPGAGGVSRLCHEPKVALAVLHSLLAPYESTGQLTLCLETVPVAAEVEGDRVRAVVVEDRRNGGRRVLQAPWFLDATELGDLLPLARVEHVTGAEGRDATGEPHAPERRDPANQQSFTMCFAMDFRPGEDHTLDRPAEYSFWRDFVPTLRPAWTGRLFSLTGTHPRTLEVRTLGFNPEQETTGTAMNLWLYRRIAAARNFRPGTYASDVSLVNWPQNDYFLGNLVGVTPREADRHIARAKQLSLSWLYWLQTEAPRPDGGTGWRGLRLRPDVLGTADGLAKAPYVRESRRIEALFTIREQECGTAARARLQGRPAAEATSEIYFDSVGIGHYAIDLHPTSAGDNYIDFESLPFHLPLGALLPVRMENLLPANKNLGTTHVTNGGYRLHPVEWNIGESAALLAVFAQRKGEPARAVRERPALLAEFQQWIRDQGVETHWPK